MYITPISTNYTAQKFYNNSNISAQNKITQPAFKGALNDVQMERVLKLLAQKNNEVFEKFSPVKLNQVMEGLINKYKSQGIRSVALQIVSNEDLPKLLGKNISKYNTSDKFGLCVAVGDKYGPIENMNNIYEAKTFLVRESDIKPKNILN